MVTSARVMTSETKVVNFAFSGLRVAVRPRLLREDFDDEGVGRPIA